MVTIIGAGYRVPPPREPLLRYLAHPGWTGLTPDAKRSLSVVALAYARGVVARAARVLGVHPDVIRYAIDLEHRHARRAKVYTDRAGDRGAEVAKARDTRPQRKHALAPDGRTVCGRRWAPTQHGTTPCRICARRVPGAR